MVASLKTNCELVVATDGDPLSVNLVNENILANNLGTNIKAQKLYW